MFVLVLQIVESGIADQLRVTELILNDVNALIPTCSVYNDLICIYVLAYAVHACA